MINRRGLLFGALAAPAIIKLAPLMRISPDRLEYPAQVVLGKGFELSGTWSVTRPIALEASLDCGTTWVKVTTAVGSDGSYLASIPCNLVAGQGGSFFVRVSEPIVTRAFPVTV